MGTQLTKIGQGLNEDEPVQASLPSTPILTPKSRVLDLDPRSPTANIVRTPIQISNGVNKIHTPIIGEIKSLLFENSIDENFTENPAVDPRSPSIDFTRTPIIIGKSAVKLRNKNLDNVKKHMTDFSPFKKTHVDDVEIEAGNKNKASVLLESSPTVPKVEEKRRSYVGLLETNIDYVETNLDAVWKKRHEESILNGKEQLETVTEDSSYVEEGKIVEEITSNEEISTNDEVMVSNEDIINTNEEVIASKEIINTNDETETKNLSCIGEEMAVSIRNVQSEETINKINKIDEEIKEVIEVTIDPTVSNRTSIYQIDDEIKNIISTPKKPTETQNTISDFDKKVSNLIYEDQETMSMLKQNKPKDTNRTPLGDRNRINHRPKSAISKLKVSDKPKGDYTVSKIPVFRDKPFKTKTQCENTPPTFKIAESRIKKSQWDADKTLII